MDFKEKDRAIYLQIADRICDEILSGTFRPGDRIPSVRSYAASIEVNANTVMRSYDHLSGIDIIFNRRGIGYFVSEDAAGRIREARGTRFLNDDLNEMFRQLHLLDISPEQLKEMYETYLNKK